MNFYRCRICGETYLGTRPPSRCPFCGATDEFFVLTSDYQGNGAAPALSETETADVLHAVEMERGNARFYRALSQRPDNPRLASGFKRLAAVETEHCSVFCKLGGIATPADLLRAAEEHGTWCDGVQESLARELHASTFYAEATGRARDPRVIEVFLAVGAVECDHIELDGIAAQMADSNRNVTVGWNTVAGGPEVMSTNAMPSSDTMPEASV